MITLICNSKKPRPVGYQTEMFKSRINDVRVGDLCELVNYEGETLNVGKVIAITQGEDTETMKVEMVA